MRARVWLEDGVQVTEQGEPMCQPAWLCMIESELDQELPDGLVNCIVDGNSPEDVMAIMQSTFPDIHFDFDIEAPFEEDPNFVEEL